MKWAPAPTTCLSSKSLKTVGKRLNSDDMPEIFGHKSDGPAKIVLKMNAVFTSIPRIEHRNSLGLATAGYGS